MTQLSVDIVTGGRGGEGPLAPERGWVRVLRFVVGVFVLAAVVRDLWLAAMGQGENDLVQTFSQFTVQSNAVFGAVLVLSAMARRASLPRGWDHLRGALAFYLVMTGIVYAVLVAPPGELWSWNIVWTNLALHRVAPLFAVVDWLLVTMTTRGSWHRPLAWMVYPLAFLVYSWIRGALTGWYPYDFLNPTLPGGWGVVLVTAAVVLAAFLVVGVVVHVLGNLRVRLATRRGAVPVA